jgi:thioredoxin 1
MKPTSVILIVVVAAAVVAVIALKPARSAPTTVAPGAATPAPAPLPRLINLGAGKCIPCKMMEPIREELRTAYAGALQVEFIDVWNDKAAGEGYGIRTIPTLIYVAPDGRELARQEGFTAKADILAQWTALGYDLKPTAAPSTP